MNKNERKKKIERINRIKQTLPSKSPKVDSRNKGNKLNIAKFIRERKQIPIMQEAKINKIIQSQESTLPVITKFPMEDKKSLKRVRTIQIQKNRSIRSEVKDMVERTTKKEKLPNLDVYKSNRNVAIRSNGKTSYESAIKNDTITINIRNTFNDYDTNIRDEMEYWQNSEKSVISAVPKHDRSPLFKKLFSDLFDYNLKHL